MPGLGAAPGAKQPLHELLRAHFQTENRHRPGFVDCHMLGDVHDQRRLAHARPGGDYDHLGGMQAARQAIERGSDGQLLRSKALGVVVCDADADGWPDIAVANDTEANFLFRNNRDGTFTEMGVTAGIGYPETGEARSGMGIVKADEAAIRAAAAQFALAERYCPDCLGLVSVERTTQ